MLAVKKTTFSTLLVLLVSIYSSFAFAIDYDSAVNDIAQRLDKASQLYEQGDKDQAKTTVQMAYFEVFESLEGPVRINYSQQYAYQLEAKFGDIRKLIVAGKPVDEVDTEINWLKKKFWVCRRSWRQVTNLKLKTPIYIPRISCRFGVKRSQASTPSSMRL